MFKRLFTEHHMTREYQTSYCQQLSKKFRESIHQIFFATLSFAILTFGSINAMTDRRESDLLAAAIDGDVERVKVILKNSAIDVNQRNIKGQTPLHLAAYHGHESVVNVLLDCGADLHLKDDASDTALHSATYKSHKSIIEQLLNSGACVDPQNNNFQTPLHIAAHNGCLTIVQLLLSHGADIRLKNRFGKTSLHLAACNGHAKVVALLLMLGADVNIRDDEGSTPLHMAVHGKHKETFALLLISGADPNQQNKGGQTPLCLAVKNRCSPLVDLLLEHGANDWPMSGVYQTPLEFVVSNGDVEIFNSLLCHPKRQFCMDDEYWNKILHILAQKIGIHGVAGICKDLPEFRATKKVFHDHALIRAAYDGDVDTVTMLLRQADSGADQSIDINQVDGKFGMTSLHWAAHNGNEVMTRLLLNFGANANYNGGAQRSPLHEAVKNRHLAVAMLLLEASEANINQKEGLRWKTPLEIAVNNRDEAMVQFLLNNRADPNIGNPLYNAVYRGDEVIVDLLLNHGAYVNKRNDDSNTPLHFAVSSEQVNVVRLLLKNGARVLKKDRYGYTVKSKNSEIEQLLNDYKEAELSPLHEAAKNGSVDELNCLLSEPQVSIDSQNKSGKTALIFAAGRGHVEVVNMLISAGADVNIRDNKGNTALHRAVMKHHWDVAHILLMHPSIDVDQQNCRGLTPLHFAAMYRGRGHEIMQLLIDHGADVAKVDRDGQLPLHCAVRTQPNPETVQLLLGRKIAVNKKDKGLLNTLSCAASSVGRSVSRLCFSGFGKDGSARLNRAETARIALEDVSSDIKINEFCIDPRDCKGQTPLHIAAKGYNGAVISLLLQYGTDAHKKDFDGQTPLQLAQGLRFGPEIIEKLQARAPAGPEEAFCCGAHKRLGAKSLVRMLPRSLLKKIVLQV